MEIHRTNLWTFRHNPGVSLSTEPSGRMPVFIAAFLLFVLTVLSFFLVGALQLALALDVAGLIGGGIGVSTWITLVVYQKRNVVQFAPPLLVEHRRRPWGWRKTSLIFPLDDIRVVAETDFTTMGSEMTFRLSLRSGSEEREFCTERNVHRRFIRELGAKLASELGCPYDDKLDHERIRVIEPAQAKEAPPARLESGESSKAFGYTFVAFGGLLIFILMFVAAPDAYESDGLFAGILVGAIMPIIPAIFVFIGLKLARTGKSLLDYENRVIALDVRGSAEKAGRRLVFDTPDAHVVIHWRGRKEHGNESIYAAYVCAGATAIPLPNPEEVTSASEDLFPWVRETANQLGLPIELVGDGVLTAWDRQVESGSLA
jgi:hypothetical protein